MSRRQRYTRNLGRSLPAPSPATVEWVRPEHETEAGEYVGRAPRLAEER